MFKDRTVGWEAEQNKTTTNGGWEAVVRKCQKRKSSEKGAPICDEASSYTSALLQKKSTEYW